jgi:CDP-diacylglycerol--glycerol-3-phosphate 3-phosphatidyltransferase
VSPSCDGSAPTKSALRWLNVGDTWNQPSGATRCRTNDAPVRISAGGIEHKEARQSPRLAARRRGSLPCGMTRERLLTLPNAVSMSRLVLAAAFIALRAPSSRFTLLVVASVTDFLDGWLARRRHATTRSGALIDPIADRLFVLTALSTYLVEGAVSLGAYFTLLARDIATLIGFIVARSIPWLRAVEFRARWLGKIVTVLQLVTLVAVLIAPAAVPWLVLVVGAASAASIADYTLTLWRERAT